MPARLRFWSKSCTKPRLTYSLPSAFARQSPEEQTQLLEELIKASIEESLQLTSALEEKLEFEVENQQLMTRIASLKKLHIAEVKHIRRELFDARMRRRCCIQTTQYAQIHRLFFQSS